MKDNIQRLGKNLLKEGEQAKFRNERKKFSEFLDLIMNRVPGAASGDQTLQEPYRSLSFLAVIGQRPITSLLILEILLKAEEKPLNGKKIGEKLAEELGIPPALTTKGGNYKDRVGDLVTAFVKIGILEPVLSKSHPRKEEGFRIKKSSVAEVKAFRDSFNLNTGVLQSLKPARLEELFEARFDQKLEYVIKSGSGNKQPFSIGKIMKSLLNPKFDISFETAMRVVEEIEPKLKTGIATLDIKSMLYNAIKKHDEKAAENYRLSYPEILSITMINGEKKTANYKLVKTLIDKEVKLRLTSSLLDGFASTVYNVITRNPANYQHETAVREYIDALIRSKCIHVRSDASFIRDHLESVASALEGCRNSIESDEVATARGLFGQFLEQICLVMLVEFGYLPFKDFTENADLISNLLRQDEVKEEILREFHLTEEDLSQFQRTRFLAQMKENASKKTLDKMVVEGERLLEICKEISKTFTPRIKGKPKFVEVSGTGFPSHVATGYDDLDNLLQGGIPANYSVILTSPSCDERDLLIERFLETGIREGQTTFHITIDARLVETLAEEFPSNFYLFICNPEADAIIKNLPNVFKLKGVENLTDVDIAITFAFRKMDKKPRESKRACIEIVSDVLLQHHAVTTRRWLTSLIPKFKSRGFTTLAVMNPHMHSSQEVQALLDLFQGEIHVYKRKTEKGLKGFLRIEKMYNQEYQEDEIYLKKGKLQT